MKQARNTPMISCLTIGMLLATGAAAQGFGPIKEKVALHRKLPALAHLTGVTIKVTVTGHDDQTELAHDLQSMLETQLLKNDPQLRADESSPSTIVSCRILDYDHPQPTVTTKQSLAVGKNAPKNQQFTRVTGALSVAFQAKTAGGQTLITENVSSKYDQEFDSSGTASSSGVKGAVTGTFNKLKHEATKIGSSSSGEDDNPPTASELRSKLMTEVVQQISEHIVNTDESIEVLLAQQKGPLDEGNKQAKAALWERALETYETAPTLPKPEEDAYRLYDIGVAYEALAYQAEDAKAAMKFLDEASINYGKAVDQRPAEKYFLEPQRRIETAIAHYKELEDQRAPKAQIAAAASGKAAGTSAGGGKAATTKGLTNAQVIAMVNAGMEDDTIVASIRSARIANFDLSAAGQRDLTGSGVSTKVLAAMKARAARKAAAAK
jgi:tetratricopeptide (TPR) repeat protein